MGESLQLPPLQHCRTVHWQETKLFSSFPSPTSPRTGAVLGRASFPDTLVVPNWQTGVPQGGSDLLAPLPRARLILLVPMWKSRLTRLIKAFVPHFLVYQTMWRSHSSGASSKGATDREGGRGQVLFEYRVAWPTQNLSLKMSPSNAIDHPTELFPEGWQNPQIHQASSRIRSVVPLSSDNESFSVWMTSAVGRWSGYPGPMPSPQPVLDADLLKLGPFCPRLSRTSEPELNSVIQGFCLTESRS